MTIWVVVGFDYDAHHLHLAASNPETASAWITEHERYGCEMAHEIVELEIDSGVSPWWPDADRETGVIRRAVQDETRAVERHRVQADRWGMACARFGSEWAADVRREFAEGQASPAAIEQFGSAPLS